MKKIIRFLKEYRLDFAIVLGFLLFSFIYFFVPVSQGLELGGHDTLAGVGQGHEQSTFYEATGERTRWTNSIFSGMPTYQISPSYGPTCILNLLVRCVCLFTTGPVSYVFFMLFGFYILMRALRFKPLISAFGAVAWALSSYFIILIAAGHIWQLNTLQFIPPTLAGIVLAYRGKYLWGGVTTALFVALQILSNHIQMSYYFLYVALFIILAYGVEALCARMFGRWCKATMTVLLGGILGVLINLPGLYHTWQYTKASTRGKSELTIKASDRTNSSTPSSRTTSGLDRDYITQWSYGLGETLTLLIPDFKGGGSGSILDRDDFSDLEGSDSFYSTAGRLQQYTQGNIPGINQYWGEQPYTMGPVYVGSFLCFLFILGLILVKGPFKWALAFATIVSLLFAWGRHLMPVTDFFIDHLPLYSRFRTVSSALVIAEFTIPLLGMLGLAEVIRHPERLLGTLRGKWALGVAVVLSAGLCLCFALVPSAAHLLSDQDTQMLMQMQQMGLPIDVSTLRNAIMSMHAAILSASAWRSFWFAAIGILLVTFYAWKPKYLPKAILLPVLIALTLFDLVPIGRRYLNESSFSDPQTEPSSLAKTDADRVILSDSTLDYRVLNLSEGNPFNESSNKTAYWHKSVGGYHAAKLRRYQEIIDFYLGSESMKLGKAVSDTYNRLTADSVRLVAQGIQTPQDLTREISKQMDTDTISPVLNMLNTKWIILGDGKIAIENHRAFGNAWFVDSLAFVPNANTEIQSLGKLPLRRAAVADMRFREQLQTAHLDSGRVTLNHYAPNELHYTAESKKGGVIVFSEIFYPDWQAFVDGKEVPVGRVNYVLRALRVPAGKHDIVFVDRPRSIQITSNIAYAGIALLLVGFVFALFRSFRMKNNESGIASTLAE